MMAVISPEVIINLREQMVGDAKPKQHAAVKETHIATLLLLFFIVIYILPLGIRDLIVPDETRYAEIPREMIASRDWISPHLNGVRYFEKPAMGYWVYAGSQLLFGENNFSARLPSAVAVGLSAVLIVLLMSMGGKNGDLQWEQKSLVAAFIFLTCFEVFGVGNTAVLDNVFAIFLTASLTAFFIATEAHPGSWKEKRFLFLSGISCGLAFLTKGFLAFALPVIVLTPYLIWQRRYRDLLRMCWIPILTAVLVALPWSIAIHYREPDFWRFFFWNEHIRRFMGNNAQHTKAFWFFLLTAPAMFLPWTFMIPGATSGIRALVHKKGPQVSLIRFSLCWLVLPFLFFSICKGKLLTYVLPCFPPFAILMGFGLFHTLNAPGRHRLFTWGARANAVFFAIGLGVFISIQMFADQGDRPYSHPYKTVMAVNALVYMILFSMWAYKSQGSIKKILIFGLSPLLLFLTVHIIMPDKTLEEKTPGTLLERFHGTISHDTVIISDEDSIRAVCWYLKRADVYILGSRDELDYGLGYEDASGRAMDIPAAIRMIASNPGKVVLMARSEHIRQWKDALPTPVYKDNSGPDGYVLWRY